jgi:hypothetical protein
VPAGNVVPNETTPSDDNPDKVIPPMPSERGDGSIPSFDNKRIWTIAEINKIKSDNTKWLKYREEITRAYAENRVVQ